MITSVLAVPRLRAFLAAAMIGRLAHGTIGLAVLLLVHDTTRTYATAGAGVAALATAAALLAPARTRWVRRRRRPRLMVLAAGYGIALGLLTVAAEVGLPSPVLLGCCVLVGSLAPPLGPETRETWAALLAEPALRRTAYSLDAMADEVLFVVGPLVAAAVVAWLGASAGIGATVVLVLGGTAAMVASPLMRTGPSRAAPTATARPLRTPGFVRMLLVMLGAGSALGSLELAATVVARERVPQAVGALPAVIAVGSLVGGALYGRWNPQRSLPWQMGVLCAALAACTLAVAAALPSPVLLVLALFVSGLFLTPILVAGYSRADELIGASARAESGALVNTWNNLGTSAGTAATAFVLDRAGLHTALVVTAAVVAGAAAVAVATRVTPRRGWRRRTR